MSCRQAIGLCTALLVLSILGCGKGDALPKYSVSGTVSYSGVPVSKGMILFVPDDGKGPVDGAPIVSGQFQGEATAGTKRVEIRATLEGKGADPKPGEPGYQPPEMKMKVPTILEMIPDKYNSKTELRKDVSTDASKNQFEFKLE